MAYSLDDFCGDARALLAEGKGRAGRDQMRQNLETLLGDAGFQTDYLAVNDESGLQQIYEDPDFGFCVLIYNMAEARTSPPHDHGRSWAIYGQASGYTDMTDWRRKDAGGDDRADLEKVRSYRLHPGKAGLYDIGDIHDIGFSAKSKFVRVTGTDMSKEARLVFDPESGSVKTIEHVGTGDA